MHEFIATSAVTRRSTAVAGITTAGLAVATATCAHGGSSVGVLAGNTWGKASLGTAPGADENTWGN
ncbi:hypothetical protein [Streptomyces sp. bgisy084]|uniref:hypothetical protein n=1 Tax=unclassified Streptomyces TaxID=2593676 RepID=UPI003D73629A